MDTLLWFKSQTGKTLTDVLLSQFLIQFSRMTKLNPGKTKENIKNSSRLDSRDKVDSYNWFNIQLDSFTVVVSKL